VLLIVAELCVVIIAAIYHAKVRHFSVCLGDIALVQAIPPIATQTGNKLPATSCMSGRGLKYPERAIYKIVDSRGDRVRISGKALRILKL